MTKNSTFARPLTTLAAALLAVPLAAQGPVVVSGQSQPAYQERVSFGDLDLRRGAAQESLRTRVKQAAKRVCREAEGPNAGYGVSGYGTHGPWPTCADLTYNNARPLIAVAIGRAKAGHRFAASAFTISTPRVR